MLAAKLCPICGTESIVPTSHSARFSVSFDYLQCTISGLRGYHCDNSHFFIVLGGRASLERPDISEPGVDLFV